MRTELPRAEMTKRTGRFLSKAYKDTEYSRREAAERGQVTEGYLTGLLAGRASVPGDIIVRSMAEGWGFNVIDFYKNLGWITDADVENYVQRNKLMGASAPADVRVLYDKLVAMPAQTRKQVVRTLLSVIDTATQRDGE